MKELIILIMAAVMAVCGKAPAQELPVKDAPADTYTETTETVTSTADPADDPQLMTISGFYFCCDDGTPLFISEEGSPILLSGCSIHSMSGIPVNIRTMAVEESYPMRAEVYDITYLPDRDIPYKVWSVLWSLEDMGYKVTLHDDFDADALDADIPTEYRY